MTLLEILAAAILPGLLTFYLYAREFRPLIADDGFYLWIPLVAGSLWPLSLLLLAAMRPSDTERQAAEAKALAERERALGLRND